LTLGIANRHAERLSRQETYLFLPAAIPLVLAEYLSERRVSLSFIT
jgi:hypothetical protein